MAKKLSKKKKPINPKLVSIVFEDLGKANFNVYASGLNHLENKDEEDWTPAEFWCIHGFKLILEMIRKSGTPITTTDLGSVQ